MQRVRAEQRGRDLVIHLDKPLNQDHLETVSGGQDEFYVDFEVADPRRARVQQRRLFFALLHDIETYFVVPSEFLKSMFYTQYEFYTAGKSISLSDHTESSVSDVNTLLDLVIDFMFEWRVPFKKGYELLPREEQYFIYQCCRHRVCLVCGEHADIHHVDVVGRTNRNKIDHSKRHVLPLCRVHHGEIESITPAKFAAKYHVPVNGIKLSVEDLKRLKIRGITMKLSEKPLNTEIDQHMQNIYKLKGQNLLILEQSLKLANEIVEEMQKKGASYLEIQEALILVDNWLYSKAINQKL